MTKSQALVIIYQGSIYQLSGLHCFRDNPINEDACLFMSVSSNRRRKHRRVVKRDRYRAGRVGCGLCCHPPPFVVRQRATERRPGFVRKTFALHWVGALGPNPHARERSRARSNASLSEAIVYGNERVVTRRRQSQSAAQELPLVLSRLFRRLFDTQRTKKAGRLADGFVMIAVLIA